VAIIEEIFKRILDKLAGADFWIALGFLAAAIVLWVLIGTTKKHEKKVLLRQIGVSLVLVLLAGGAIWMHQVLFLHEPVFPKDVTGILVMRIVGDDTLNSLQGDLVEKLNAELQKEAADQQVEVHAGGETLDESKGLADAHDRARAIGHRLNAKLVIWGRKIGEKKFYPRITVMAALEKWSAARERTHEEQSITELHLPEELVDEPFYLIHFAGGYSYYIQKNFKEAVVNFKAALRRKGSSANELADLQFFTAVCDLSLAAGQRNIGANCQEAIELFAKAAKVYEATDKGKWAKTQNNLGIAYSELPTGDRAENMKKAIAAHEAALGVFTQKDFPTDWATAQNNLGSAYWALPTGDRAENLKKAIAAYEAALRVYTEKDFPTDWAKTQNNLGIAYSDLPTGDRAENLKKAIAAYEAALRVCTEKDFPTDWAMAQNNLGSAYWALPTGDRAENLKKAIAAYESALGVYTEKDFPTDWAMAQNNLGIAYRDLPTGDRVENVKKAKNCFEAALRVYTASGFPEYHREAAAHLADVEQQLRNPTSQ
jgi:tetratricopeptide (TPR) repeat protein